MEASIRLRVPFYRQHYDFTCGPAALMMAMKYFDKKLRLTRSLEMDVWREGNMVEIYGTSRYGLAFSAATRGFTVKVASNIRGIDYVDRLHPKVPGINRRVLLSLFEERRRRCQELGVKEEKAASITSDDVRDALGSGKVPILLTSTKLFGEKDDLPHWVTATGFDERRILVNNPLGAHGGAALPLDWIRNHAGYKGDQCMVSIGRPHATLNS